MCIIAAVTFVLFLSAVQCSSFNSTSPIADVAIHKDVIFVGSGRKISRLNEYLQLNGTLNLPSASATISKLSISSNGNKIVICLTDGSCLIYSSTLTIEQSERVEEDATVPGRPFSLISVSTDVGDSFYVGSEGSTIPLILDSRDILIGQFGFENGNIYRTSNGDFSVSSTTFTRRNFIDSFSVGNYIYFVVSDEGTASEDSAVRVLRVCNDAESDVLGSMYEVVLDCGTTTKIVSSVTLMNWHSRYTVVMSISSEGENAVCAFSLNDIDAEMSRTFSECLSGSMDVPLVWSDQLVDSCMEFTEDEVSECNFGLSNGIVFIPALGGFRSVEGVQIINFGNRVNKLTSILFMSIDSVRILYVSYSSRTNHVLNKYRFVTDMTVTHLTTVEYQSPITSLYWLPGRPFFIAVFTHKILTIQASNCPVHRNCSSCRADTSHLCGWCTVENKCSRASECKHQNLSGRWIQVAETCPQSITILPKVVAVENLKHIDIQFQPLSYQVFETDTAESFFCIFRNVYYNYSFAAKLNGSTCTLSSNISLVNRNKISLNVTLVSLEFGSIVIEFIDMLLLINCSQHTRCNECVEAGACGWCLLSGACRGSADECTYAQNWLHHETSETPLDDICPELLIPSLGHYFLSDPSQHELIFQTKKFPELSLESDFSYQCRLDDNITVVILPAVKHLQLIICKLSDNTTFKQFMPIVEGMKMLKASVIVASNESHVAKYGSVKVLLYRCNEIATSCSSCLASSIMYGYGCGWCYRSYGADSCLSHDDCMSDETSMNVYTSSVANCPLPMIIELLPASGPTAGGTAVTIRGTDLGLHARDIMGVMFGTSACTMLWDAYIPGKELICNTSEAAIVGEVDVIVTIKRNLNTFVNATANFVYAVPTIFSVIPPRGPKSGGTEITVNGRSLAVGNTSYAMVKLAGVNCTIDFISDDYIICTSQGSSESVGLVQVIVDTVSLFGGGIYYWYTPDPTISSVYPQKTIPAGGVAITFMGENLDVVQNPQITITLLGRTASSLCQATNATVLECKMPRLTFLSKGRVPLQEFEMLYGDSLEYMVEMGNAPAPSYWYSDLQLKLQPNPVFINIEHGTVQQCPPGQHNAVIVGKNFHSVLIKEIDVMIGSAECQITHLTDETLNCCVPEPSSLTLSIFSVHVVIGNGSLEYTLEDYHFNINDNNSLMQLISSVVSVAVFLIIILLLVAVIAVYCIYKRITVVESMQSSSCSKSAQSAHKEDCSLGEEDNEHLYDVIPGCSVGRAANDLTGSGSVYENDGDQVLFSDITPTRMPPHLRPLPPSPSSSMGDYTIMRQQVCCASLMDRDQVSNVSQSIEIFAEMEALSGTSLNIDVQSDEDKLNNEKQTGKWVELEDTERYRPSPELRT